MRKHTTVAKIAKRALIEVSNQYFCDPHHLNETRIARKNQDTVRKALNEIAELESRIPEGVEG